MLTISIRGLTNSLRLFPRRISQRRAYTTEVPPAPSPKKMEGPGEDPRPPWVYTSTRLVSVVVIPVVGLYSIFFYDFGGHEHVFQPPRRWAKSLINDAFTLSSAEEKLLLQEKQLLLQQQTVAAATPEKAL